MRVSLKRTKGFVFIAAAALLGSALMAAPQPKQDNGQQSAPDNSKTNKRDRDKSSPTADRQKMNPTDRDLAKRIRPLQCHLSVLRYDLDVVGVGRKGFVISDGRPDPFRQVAVRRIHLLPIRCWRTLVAVPFIRLAIVGCRLLAGILPWLRSGHHTTAEQSRRSYENKAFRSLQ